MIYIRRNDGIILQHWCWNNSSVSCFTTDVAVFSDGCKNVQLPKVLYTVDFLRIFKGVSPVLQISENLMQVFKLQTFIA